MSDALKQLCLEVAATCDGHPTLMAAQIGRLRVISAWYWGKQGLDFEETEMATEAMVAKTLDAIADLQRLGGQRQ